MGVHYLTRENNLPEAARYFEKSWRSRRRRGRSPTSAAVPAVPGDHQPSVSKSPPKRPTTTSDSWPTNPKMDIVEKNYLAEYEHLLKTDAARIRSDSRQDNGPFPILSCRSLENPVSYDRDIGTMKGAGHGSDEQHSGRGGPHRGGVDPERVVLLIRMPAVRRRVIRMSTCW